MKASNTVRTVRRRFTQCAAIYNAGEEVVSIGAKTLQGNVVTRRITSPSSAGKSIYRAGLPSPAGCQFPAYSSSKGYLNGNDTSYQSLADISAIKSKPKSTDTYSSGFVTKLELHFHDQFQIFDNEGFEPKQMEGS